MLRCGEAEGCHVGEPPCWVSARRELCPCSFGDFGQRERSRYGVKAWIGHQFSSNVSTISGYASFNRSITMSVRLNSATAKIDS